MSMQKHAQATVDRLEQIERRAFFVLNYCKATERDRRILVELHAEARAAHRAARAMRGHIDRLSAAVREQMQPGT